MKPTHILAAIIAITPLLRAATVEDPHRKAAQELLQLMNSREIMLSAFESTTTQVLQQVPEAKRDAVREAFVQFAVSVADSPELNNGLINIYMETFSEPELTEMTAFYSTPTGKKALEKMPELFQKGAKIGEEVATAKQAEFQAKLQQIMASE